MKHKLAVVTAVYNGEAYLPRLYGSMENQRFRDFTWIAVNDGSRDGSMQVLEGIARQASFPVIVHSIPNGGKQRALNHAFRTCTGYDFYLVVDCDENLTPEALETVASKMEQYAGDPKVGAIYGWRDMKNDPNCAEQIKNRPRGDRVMTIYERLLAGTQFGDGIIGYYRRLLDKIVFPEFPNEKFVGEITLVQKAAIENVSPYIVYIDCILSIGEYTQGGMTALGRKLRVKNPLGMIYYSSLMQSELNKNPISRAKHSVGAQAYASIWKISKEQLREAGIPTGCLKPWAKLPGAILGRRWAKLLEQ